MTPEYQTFLAGKAARAPMRGLTTLPPIKDHLFPFQRHCVEFALRCGSAGIFLDTGLGKTAGIARVLTASGHQATKNAVIGRANRHGHRLGIEPRRAAYPRKLTGGGGVTPPPCQPDASKPLPPTGCRWIFGDAAGWKSRWCDAPVCEPGGSWCVKHRSIVFRKPNGWEAAAVGERSTEPRAQRQGTVFMPPGMQALARIGA